jgi:radical SAM protein with 4Fe4S-binding SPASM domain
MGVMDENLFTKIINEFVELSKANHFRGHVIFCNMGELFVRPAMAVDRMNYVIQSGLDFDIQTNAALLHPSVLDRLKKSGFKGSIVISFHGISPNIYKDSMGLDITTTLKNIDYLLQNYPREKIGIQSIPYHWPRGEAGRIRAYFSSRGIHVRMPLPNNRAGLIPDIAVHRKKRLIGCTAGRPLGEMVVLFNGDVVLCCNDMAQEEIVGNLKKSSIEEVWNGEIMLDKISRIYFGKSSPENFICKKCEFGATSRSVFSRLIKNMNYEIRKFVLTRF